MIIMQHRHNTYGMMIIGTCSSLDSWEHKPDYGRKFRQLVNVLMSIAQTAVYCNELYASHFLRFQSIVVELETYELKLKRFWTNQNS